MYYYGARYYAAWTCRFVSVDPLAGKYLEWSPYVYCADNPIKYIDPDGREISLSFSKKENKTKFLSIATELLKSSSIFAFVSRQLKEDYDVYHVQEFTRKDAIEKDQVVRGYYGAFNDSYFKKDHTVIRLNPNRGMVNGFNKATIFEEFFHAGQDIFYSKFNRVQFETEAKMARIFEVYKSIYSLEATLSMVDKDKKANNYIESGKIGSLLEKYVEGLLISEEKKTGKFIVESLIKSGIQIHDMTLIFDEGKLNTVVMDYFDTIISNENVSLELENKFREEMITFSQKLDEFYVFENREQLSNYRGDFEYFKSIINEL
jgi:hypothetical protein